MDPHILILAAGGSSRMRGTDKLMEVVDGQPLILRIATASLATGGGVTVALAPDRPARATALDGLDLQRVLVPDAADGMSQSLKAGNAAIAPDRPLMLLLADLPEMTAADLDLMLREWRSTPDLILRGAAADGTAGHPVCLPAWSRPEINGLHGDEGARSLLNRHKDRLRLVPLPGAHATTDLDTPEAWADWRARNP